MRSLVYASRAVQPFSEQDLLDLLTMGFAHLDAESLEETMPGYRAGNVYPFVDSQLVSAADTASTLLTLYARRAD